MSFHRLAYHVVFGTKHREHNILSTIQQPLYECIRTIIREKKGQLIEVGGMSDHIHILAYCSPTVSVSDWIRDIKANSSRWVNQNFPDIGRFEWQLGYGAFTVSHSLLETVQIYIQRQEIHHSVRSFQDEFVEILKRHQIEFDPQRLFDDQHHG